VWNLVAFEFKHLVLNISSRRMSLEILGSLFRLSLDSVGSPHFFVHKKSNGRHGVVRRLYVWGMARDYICKSSGTEMCMNHQACSILKEDHCGIVERF